jgi:hypothetical protein
MLARVKNIRINFSLKKFFISVLFLKDIDFSIRDFFRIN